MIIHRQWPPTGTLVGVGACERVWKDEGRHGDYFALCSRCGHEIKAQVKKRLDKPRVFCRDCEEADPDFVYAARKGITLEEAMASAAVRAKQREKYWARKAKEEMAECRAS